MMYDVLRRRKSRRHASLPTRRRFATLLVIALGFLSLAGCSAASGHNEGAEIRRPAKRSYDTHAYYVMELLEGSDESEAQNLASMLGAELVEQVGELRDHWLLRAPFELEKRGSSSQDHDRVMQRYYDLAIEQQQQQQYQGLRHASPLNWIKDHVARDQHQHGGHGHLLPNLRSRSSPPRASRSASASNIISLDKQIIKKRVKRQIPAEYLEPAPRLWPRQSDQEPTVSQFLRDIAERFSIVDPLWPKQWHLANDKMQENSINVTGVWDQGITGEGIKVAIVDDGLDSRSMLCISNSSRRLQISSDLSTSISGCSEQQGSAGQFRELECLRAHEMEANSIFCYSTPRGLGIITTTLICPSHACQTINTVHDVQAR